MFKITDGTIHCSRGDAGSIKIKIPTGTNTYYSFQVGDKIKFNIYNKNGYDADTMLSKVVTVTSVADSVTIPLTEEDTTFGDIPNKETTYWYDVTLNEDQTVICYNEDGPREFIQYPAKGDEE